MARRGEAGEAADTPASGGVDIEAQKKLNAEAPEIPDLGRRVVALFRPYRGRSLITGFLVVVGAAHRRHPAAPRAADLRRRAVPARRIAARHPAALAARGRDDRAVPAVGGARRGADLAHLDGRQPGHGRPAGEALRAPAGDGARLLHAHQDRRHPVAPAERRGRRLGRAHEHRDEHPRQPRDGRRLARRDDPHRLAAHDHRRRAHAVPRDRAATRGPGAGAHRRRDAGVALGADGHHAGDAERLGHPAVEVLQPAAHRVEPLSGREPQPGAPAGAPGDERPGLLRRRAGAHGERPRGHLPRLGLPHRRAAPTRITAGTIVAFTTVQARLLMPLMGLMRVALDLQTSAALFARIFEYLDLVPAIRDASRRDRRRPTRPARSGASSSATSVFRYPDAAADSRGRPCAASRSRPSRVSTSRSSGRRARARRRCST